MQVGQLVLAMLDRRGRAGQMIAGDGEVAAVGVDLDPRNLSLLRILGKRSRQKDLHTGAARTDFGVAVQVLDDSLRPRLNDARLWIATLVKIDTGERWSAVNGSEGEA